MKRASAYPPDIMPRKTPPPPKKPSPARAKKPVEPKSSTIPLQAELLALPDSYAAPTDVPVADIAYEGRELQGLMTRLGKQLLERSRLEASLLDQLPQRIAALDAAEGAWAEIRAMQLPSAKKKLRTSAEALRGRVIEDLRHFVPADTELQVRLNKVVEGRGIADLIDDLKKLAPLFAANRAKLTRSTLPSNTDEELRAQATALEEATREQAVEAVETREAGAAQELRNRAYWYLREAIDEIRVCGVHACRDNPRLVKLFKSSYARRTERASKGKKKPE